MMLWGRKILQTNKQNYTQCSTGENEMKCGECMRERDKATGNRFRSVQMKGTERKLDERNKQKYRCDEVENVERNCCRHKTETGENGRFGGITTDTNTALDWGQLLLK